MHLLDTDILSLLQRNHDRALRKFESCDDTIGTTVVSWVEIIRARCDRLLKAANAAELVSAQTWLDRSIQFLQPFLIVPINGEVANNFTLLDGNRALRRIGRADVLIASIASAHRPTLVTRNVRHFAAVHELKVVNWAD